MPSWTNFSWYSGLVLDSSQFFITQKILFISKKVQSGSKIIIIVGIATFMHFVLQCDNRLFGHQVHKLTGIHKTLQNAGSQTQTGSVFETSVIKEVFASFKLAQLVNLQCLPNDYFLFKYYIFVLYHLKNQ